MGPTVIVTVSSLERVLDVLQDGDIDVARELLQSFLSGGKVPTPEETLDKLGGA